MDRAETDKGHANENVVVQNNREMMSKLRNAKILEGDEGCCNDE